MLCYPRNHRLQAQYVLYSHSFCTLTLLAAHSDSEAEIHHVLAALIESFSDYS